MNKAKKFLIEKEELYRKIPGIPGKIAIQLRMSQVVQLFIE